MPPCVQILSTFGDLALALGDSFLEFLEPVKRMLGQAMHLSVHQAAAANADDDALDYNNELRIGILEAYSGIFQGIGPGVCFTEMHHTPSLLCCLVAFHTCTHIRMPSKHCRQGRGAHA